MLDHVTYRIPRDAATLVEKLFKAYQVPHEEMGPEDIFIEAMRMDVKEIKDVSLENVGIDPRYVFNTLADRFHK